MNSNTPLEKWEAHRNCVVCGEDNPLGLGIRFHMISESKVEAHWRVSQRLQGYTGLLQGGVTAALLDSAMVNCLRLHGIEAYTAEINVRYLKPIAVGSLLHITGFMLRSRNTLHWAESHIYVDHILAAKASGKFVTKDKAE